MPLKCIKNVEALVKGVGASRSPAAAVMTPLISSCYNISIHSNTDGDTDANSPMGVTACNSLMWMYTY